MPEPSRRMLYNVISTNMPGNNVLLSSVEQTILVEPSPPKHATSERQGP